MKHFYEVRSLWRILTLDLVFELRYGHTPIVRRLPMWSPEDVAGDTAMLIQRIQQAFKAEAPHRCTLRVLVADDNKVVRRAICRLLEVDVNIEVVCEAFDGEDAIRKAQDYKPDVVLMDLAMPGMNGLTAARCIRGRLPSTRIVIVTQHDSASFEREAIACGASQYILKTEAGKELLPALRKFQSERS